MTMIRTARVRAGMVLPVAALAVFAVGCGTEQSAADAYRSSHPTPTGVSKEPVPSDTPCPGETAPPTPAPSASLPTPTRSPGASGPAVPIPDHYAENHGFMVPFPLHGQARCNGLKAAERIKAALEPLRARGDFTAQHTRRALTGLGYGAGQVEVIESGGVAVSFLVDASTKTSTLCLEGNMNRAVAETDAFGGYPDHTGCDQPSGGH
ncbi:hypothetical protein [Streptomyces sp. NPDC005485]|uniref:hypothetical protein n=1 Tax=Streptomyces sp. NPDC005485 TaxID=3155591 RepID=UPI0033B64634